MFGESLAQLLHQRSDALSVVASSSSGRTLVLTRPVARGETVIRESALVKAAHFVGSRCANCLCQLNDRPHGSPIVRCCELPTACRVLRADACIPPSAATCRQASASPSPRSAASRSGFSGSLRGTRSALRG